MKFCKSTISGSLAALRDERRTLRLCRREDDVFRRAHAREIEHHFRALDLAAGTVDVPAALRNAHAQPPQTVQMQVDGAKPDVAPARVGDARPAEPRHDRTEHEHGRAQLLGERRGNLVVGGVGAVDNEVVSVEFCIAAELAEDADHVQNVGDARAFMDDHPLVGEHGSRKQREHGVLGGLNFHFAEERAPPSMMYFSMIYSFRRRKAVAGADEPPAPPLSPAASYCLRAPAGNVSLQS